MLKAFVAVKLGSAVFDAYLGLRLEGEYFSALFCVIGHIFPAFYSFKGGKGILCSGTLLLLLDWRIAAVGWGLFALLWLTTRYVSLGSVSGAVSFPVTTLIFCPGNWCHTGAESCFFNPVYVSDELKQFTWQGLYELIEGG